MVGIILVSPTDFLNLDVFTKISKTKIDTFLKMWMYSVNYELTIYADFNFSIMVTLLC